MLFPNVAVFVGAELKSNKDHEVSLWIVTPIPIATVWSTTSSSALALVARIGGIARIVWDNGGAYGVLEEDQIIVAHAIYEQSLASERQRQGEGAAWVALDQVVALQAGGLRRLAAWWRLTGSVTVAILLVKPNNVVDPLFVGR